MNEAADAHRRQKRAVAFDLGKQLSNELSALAYRARVGSGAGKAVLAALADQANADGVCWPSITYIVERTEWDRKTVERWIARLEEMGHLSVMRKNGASSVYRIHPRLPPDDPLDTESEVTRPAEPVPATEEISPAASAATNSTASAPTGHESASGASPEAAPVFQDYSTWVPKSQVDNSTVSVDNPVKSSTHRRPKVGGTSDSVTNDHGLSDQNHRLCDPQNPKNLHLNPQLTSEGPDGKKNPQAKTTGVRSRIREQLPKPPPRDSGVALSPEEAERQKAKQLEAIRARGIAV